MYLAQMLTAAAKYGFPIIVSCYLLVREEEVNSKNPTNLTFNNRLVGFFFMNTPILQQNPALSFFIF